MTDLCRQPTHLYLCAGHPGRPSGSVPCLPVQPLSNVPPPGISNESRATSLLSALLSLTEASPVMSVWPRLPLLVTLSPERTPCPPASSPSAHTRPSTPTGGSEHSENPPESQNTHCASPGQPGEPFLPGAGQCHRVQEGKEEMDRGRWSQVTGGNQLPGKAFSLPDD